MKTFSTLLASLFLSVSVFAAAKPTSTLTIKSADNSDIRVVLDGKRFEPNDNALMISNLNEGVHSVKVYKQRGNGAFNILGKRYELVYNTSLNLKKRTHLFVTIERNGRISMTESKVKGNGNFDDSYGRDRDRDRDDDYYDYDRDGQWGDYDAPASYGRGMSNSEFSRVLQSIDKEWLEGNKLKSATQVVRNNQLTSAQVKQLVQLFGFENNKLELAKQAYANTVDKRNYDIIFDVFSFSTSRTELERFIRTGR